MSHGDLSPLAAAHSRRPHLTPASLLPAAETSDASRASPLSRAHLHREEHRAPTHSTLGSKDSAMLPGRALSPMSRAHDADRRPSYDAGGLRRPPSELSAPGEGHMSPLSKSHSKTSHAREKLPERHDALGEPSPLSMAHSKDGPVRGFFHERSSDP